MDRAPVVRMLAGLLFVAIAGGSAPAAPSEARGAPEVEPDGAGLVPTILSVEIDGSMCVPPDGTKEKYTITIKGKGAGVYRWSVLDDDCALVDDTLLDEQDEASIDDGTWTETYFVELWCDTFLGDEVVGPNGCSDEGADCSDPAEVYVLVEAPGGLDLASSARMDVCCSTAPDLASSAGSALPLASLDPVDAQSGGEFGRAVSTSGTRAVIGSPGHSRAGMTSSGGAWIFERQSDGVWKEVQELVPSDGASGDELGTAVSMVDGRALVGTNRGNDAAPALESVYVFERQASGDWIEVDRLMASDGSIGDGFGHSLSIDGDLAVAGAPDADGGAPSSGAAYVYERQGDGTWVEGAKLVPQDPGSGDDFGRSVSLCESRAVVGAPFDDDAGSSSGSAHVFDRAEDGTWSVGDEILASDGAPIDWFGFSVAVSNSWIVVGAPFDDDLGISSGSAYAFERQLDGTWLEASKMSSPTPSTGDRFGWSVASNGDFALVGAPGDTVGLTAGAGSAHLFEPANGLGALVASFTHSAPSSGDGLGHSVALSKNRALVGAPGDGGDAGGARLFHYFAFGAPSVQGTGTPGCDGVSTLSIDLPPETGTAGFSITCDRAPTSSAGLLALADVADPQGSDPLALGVIFHVDLFAANALTLLPMPTDAEGTGSLTLPIPDSPALVGTALHAQALWLWTTCALPPSQLSSSRLLSFAILAP